LSLHNARISFFLRDYDRAMAQFASMLELYPNHAVAHEYFGDVCEKKGNEHEAITQWCAALNLGGQPEHARVLEQVFASAGFDAALRALAQRRLDDLDGQRERGEYVPAAHYVFAHVRRGSIDEALAWLPRMLEEPNWFALQVRVNPILDPLRAHPRFEQVMAELAPR
jgi:tetratricopeptide (TPR) repeat protein